MSRPGVGAGADRAAVWAGPIGPFGDRCSLPLPQEPRRAPGPRRRGSAGGDFSASFVFGEAEAGGEGAWAAALRQLRGKVRPGAGSGCGAWGRPAGLLTAPLP